MPDNVTGAKDMLGGGERLDCCNLESKHEMRGWQHSRAKNGESSQTGTPEISAVLVAQNSGQGPEIASLTGAWALWPRSAGR